MITAWIVYTNANLFETKRKLKIGKHTTKLTFIWYDNFGNKSVSAEEWHGSHYKKVVSRSRFKDFFFINYFRLFESTHHW